MAEFLERAQPWAITLIDHNWPVMIYALVAGGAASWADRRPARKSVLFLYGACLLVIAYEYEKHGRETILGTTEYLFSVEVNARARVVSRWLLLDLVPLLMQVSGFGLLVGSLALHRRELRRPPRRVELGWQDGQWNL
jgi:hypothetical protein